MITKDFKGFFAGIDETKIPFNYLTGKSKNVFIENSVIKVRKGYELLGERPDELHTEEEVYSGDTWLTSGGVHNLFSVSDKKFRVYLDEEDKWMELLDLWNEKDRVRFAKWVDTNNTIIKDRLFFVDGSGNMYMWNGARAKVSEINGNTITIEGTRTLAQIGFDNGDEVTQAVMVNGEEKSYTQADLNTLELELDDATGINVGDWIVAKPMVYSNAQNLNDFHKNHIWSSKNQIYVGSLDEERVYVSDMNAFTLTDGLDFTIPASQDDRTIATPFMMTFDGKIQAIDQKRDKIRVFTENDIFVVRKRDDMTMGFFVDVYKQDLAYNIGSFPYATANFKGDLFYVSRNKTVEMITDADTQNEVQTIKISKDIDDLLKTLDFEGVRLRVYRNYVILILPKERKSFFYDIDEKHWNPPQILPINDIIIYNDEMIGISTTGNITYKLFTGGNDDDLKIDATIEFGSAELNSSEFSFLKLKSVGFHTLMSRDTNFNFIENYFTAGEWKDFGNNIKGMEIPYFIKDDNIGIGETPVADTSIGDTNVELPIISRSIFKLMTNNVSFLLFKPVIEISQKDPEFTLVSIEFNIDRSGSELGEEYFIQKQDINNKITKEL